jgi:hypothetical protein
LHTDIEGGSTGMPIYSKMIDKTEMFNTKVWFVYKCFLFITKIITLKKIYLYVQ